MKTTTLALLATLLATPLAAQSLRDCDTFEANARNIYGPYAETIREYANGAIRVIALDVGEPAGGSYHVMVTYPHPDEPWQHCALISREGSLGFGALYMDGVEASYDAAIGLSVTVPVGFWSPDSVEPLPGALSLVVNQATGTVTANASQTGGGAGASK